MMIDVLAQPHRQHSHTDSLHTGQYRSTTPAHSHATFALRGRNEDTHEKNAASSASTTAPAAAAASAGFDTIASNVSIMILMLRRLVNHA